MLAGIGLQTLQDFAPAAEDAGRGQEEDRRRDQQQNPEAGKDPDDLCAVPDDRDPGVSQLSFALPGVVVPQEKVVLRKKISDIVQFRRKPSFCH